MKKTLLISFSALLFLSSCGTYAGEAAGTGAMFGSIIGSAIGGITGGPRGSDIGTLVGMAGGAVVGAAIGQAADNAEQQRYAEYRDYRAERAQREAEQEYRQGHFQGDDRLYGVDEDFNSTVTDVQPSTEPSSIEIRHARFLDASRDGALVRGEEGRVIFELYNHSSRPAFRVRPTVMEVTGNRHIRISENVLIECIPAGKAVRYTAIVKADDRLKDGEAVIRVGVLQSSREVPSQEREFIVPTRRR